MAGLAFMRMMGVDSFDYYGRTLGVEMTAPEASTPRPARPAPARLRVAPEVALGYYASRGETPLQWGGKGAARLGLGGEVSRASFEAIFGPGGATDPVLGTRLVSSKRPGMELVVAAHKSVAELDVLGQSDDMHRILTAETRATMGYLEQVTMDAGGRRGRAATMTPTSGLVYATTRHATTRAEDPGVHDHVLVGNVVEMLDPKGGWKAPNTALWRDELHAATTIGRMHAAWEATRLGYAIRPDDGPSGRLGQWAIAGIPQKVLDLHSKRSQEIDEMIGADASPRARGIAARDTRDKKRATPMPELLDRWRSELVDAGHPPTGVWASIVERANATAPLAPQLTAGELERLTDWAVGVEGPLAERKVFTRREVIVAVGPKLYGRHPSELTRTVNAVLTHPEIVPLLPSKSGGLTAFTTASVLATEHAIAATVETAMRRDDAPRLAPAQVWAGIDQAETALGGPLTEGQRAAVAGVCESGAGAEVVIGIAGAGKTTAVAAIGAAYTGAGYTVVGAATAGQAAHTLGDTAAIDTSTVASLTYRIEHSQLTLTPSTVLILDEAGMTDDPAMLGLLTHAQLAGTKVVLVGDDRQLSAVGPGGALGALVDRWPDRVHLLRDDVRHRTPGEASALEQLRHGDATKAVEWMAAHGRIVAVPDRHDRLRAAVAGWDADVTAGRDTILLAWRRDDVAALNHYARHAARAAGRLHGPELYAGELGVYQAGDRVLALASNRDRTFLTSQRGTITHVDDDARTMTVRVDGTGVDVTLSGPELEPDRLTLGYATTVHRAQGLTVDTAHVLEDGGGREVAYVKASRARDTTHLYVDADTVDQAAEDLSAAWASERRKAWVIDTQQPGTPPPATGEYQAVRDAMRRLALDAEAHAVRALLPERRNDLATAVLHCSDIQRDIDQLRDGYGPAATPEIKRAADDLRDATAQRDLLQRRLDGGRLGWRERRHARADIGKLDHHIPDLTATLDTLTAEPLAELIGQLNDAEAACEDMTLRRNAATDWLTEHPDVARRLEAINIERAALQAPWYDAAQVDRALGITRSPTPPTVEQGMSIEL